MGLISKVTFWWKHDVAQTKADHHKATVAAMRNLIKEREQEFRAESASVGFSETQADFLWKRVMLEIYLHNHLYGAEHLARTGLWLELQAITGDSRLWNKKWTI